MPYAIPFKFQALILAPKNYKGKFSLLFFSEIFLYSDFFSIFCVARGAFTEWFLQNYFLSFMAGNAVIVHGVHIAVRIEVIEFQVCINFKVHILFMALSALRGIFFCFCRMFCVAEFAGMIFRLNSAYILVIRHISHMRGMIE